MLLALSVISSQVAGMGSGAYKVFDERGGSIGRLESNDWALPDPERFVSSRHAVVRFADGAFCLEDVSTNGTFINSPDQAVSRREPVRLKDGDRLFVGDYEILVQLIDDGVSSGTDDPLAVIGVGSRAAAPERSRAAGAQAAPSAPTPVPAQSAPAQAVPAQPAPVQSASASLPPEPSAAPREPGAQAFIPDGAVFTLFSPERRPSAVPPAPAAQPPGGASSAQPAAVPSAQPAAVPSAQPAAVSSAQPAALSSARPTAAAQSRPAAQAERAAGAAELFAALGLDARDVDPEAAAQLGAILRTVVQGLIEVLRARSEVKNNFRMPMTSIRPIENNPLKFSLNAEDALHNLFVKRNPGYLGPLEAFHEGFEDIAFHELAMLAGIRAAYQAMIANFSPAHLEEVYTRKLRRASLIHIGARLKFWDLYCEQFEEIEQDKEGSFQLLFGEEFAKAYHEQLDKLAQAAKRHLHKKRES